MVLGGLRRTAPAAVITGRSTKGVEAGLAIHLRTRRWFAPAWPKALPAAAFVLLATCSASPLQGAEPRAPLPPLTPAPIDETVAAPQLTVDAVRTGVLGDDG